MKIVRDTLLIAWMKSYPDIRRNPLIMIVIGMINAMPLFFIAIFARGEMFIHGLVGAMVSTVGLLGIMASIQEMAWDRYVKIREMIVAMPIHPVSYAVGIALAPLIISVPGLALFIILTILTGNVSFVAILYAIPLLLMCWLCMSAIGFLISTYLRKLSPYALNNISNIIGIGLMFIPPVYYPEEMLGSFSWISQLIPTSNVAGLIRGTLGLSNMKFEVYVFRFALLLVITVICLLLTSFKARWREI